MKNVFLIVTLFSLFSPLSFASDTDCWTDSQGNIHCSSRSDGDITPKGAY